MESKNQEFHIVVFIDVFFAKKKSTWLVRSASVGWSTSPKEKKNKKMEKKKKKRSSNKL
jgi:hypothetical protein